jgi:hypothetical protein
MRKLLIVCALLLCETPAHPARLQTQWDEAVRFRSWSIAIAEPQKRDSELFGFRPVRLIPDSMVQRSLTVLRCDDRGVGRSTRFFISFDLFTALRRAVCSVFALFGGTDLQVPEAVNRARLETALAVESATLPKAFVALLVGNIAWWIARR